MNKVSAFSSLLISAMCVCTAAAQDLYVGNNSSGVAETFSSGTNIYENTYVGVTAADSNNILNVFNTDTLLTNSGVVIIGDSGSSNNLTVQDGAVFKSGNSITVGNRADYNSIIVSNGGTVTAGDYIVIGNHSGSNNSVVVAGSGSVLSNATGLISVGRGGESHRLTITNGGVLHAGSDLHVGSHYSPNNSMTVTGSGSGAFVTGGILVGDQGPSNSLTIREGAFIHAGGEMTFGLNGSSNTVLIDGSGSVLSNATGLISVGRGGESHRLTITNGGVLHAGSDLHVGSHYSPNNSMTVTGSGSGAFVTGGILVGGAGTNNSLTVANGATLSSTSILLGDHPSGRGTINIGTLGGTDSAGIVEVASITFGAGGGSINFNQTNTFAFTSTVSGNGALNQLGSGTTLFSNTVSHTGATTVGNGTLLVEGTISLSDVSVLAGAAIGGGGLIGGNLSLLTGAAFVFSLTDTMLVNGSSVTFEDFGIDDLVGLTQDTPNGTYTLIDGSALIETNNLRNFGLDNAFTFLGSDKKAYFTEGSLQVTVVPEPSTYALLLLSGAASLWALKRRKS